MIHFLKNIIKPLIPLPVRLGLRTLQNRVWQLPADYRKYRAFRKIKARNKIVYERDIFLRKAKLHLGCGDDYREEYINIDFFNKTYADKRWKLNNLRLPDECCERVESYAVLEHLNYIEFYECLEECYRVLVSHGVLIFEIPEFEEYMKSWLAQDHKTKWSFEWISPIWGGQWNHGQYHKAGYSFQRIKEILEEIGFTNVIRTTPSKSYPPCVMQRVEAVKKSIPKEDYLRKLEERSEQFEKWGHIQTARSIRKKIQQLQSNI